MAGDVRSRDVLVVDDVMTSGSTMDEIARLLVSAGAAHVHALVVARTP
jgi:predicted amidophosphoribosyltransferase